MEYGKIYGDRPLCRILVALIDNKKIVSNEHKYENNISAPDFSGDRSTNGPFPNWD
jgi:hypothetical protein